MANYLRSTQQKLPERIVVTVFVQNKGNIQHFMQIGNMQNYVGKTHGYHGNRQISKKCFSSTDILQQNLAKEKT